MSNKAHSSLVGVERPLERRDWNPTLGMLPAANRKPLSVTRETPVERARTLMLINDFSQLPVMNGDRTLRGMISWKSLGRAAARNEVDTRAADFLDDKQLPLRSATPLLEAITEIARREVVLVRGTDRSVVGLV